MMQRQVRPELLDELPPEDFSAVRSRNDLQRINGLMGHLPTLADWLIKANAGPSFQRLVELGAGDGTFALKLARRLAPSIPEMEIVLLDRINSVSESTLGEFKALGWTASFVNADVFAWLGNNNADRDTAFLANLFLHHFTPEQLRELFLHASRQNVLFAACDPRRSRFALTAGSLLGVIGCNSVTRHDARLSIHAGFRGRELSALWPQSPEWHLQEKEVGLFSHGFCATRR